MVYNGALPVAATPTGACHIDVERFRTLKTIDDAGTGRTSENGIFMIDGNYYVEGKGGCGEPLYGWNSEKQNFRETSAAYQLATFTFGMFMKIETNKGDSELQLPSIEQGQRRPTKALQADEQLSRSAPSPARR
jgi:hypothetical protein